MGAGHLPGGIEAELGLEGLDVKAAGAAPLMQRRRRLPRHRQRLAGRLWRLRPAGEDRVEAIVVKAGVGADAAAVKASRAWLGLRPQLDLGGHREALLPGREAARLAAQGMRQHRLDRPRRVGTVGAASGLAVKRRAGRYVRSDVGDMDPDARPVSLAPGRD